MLFASGEERPAYARPFRSASDISSDRFSYQIGSGQDLLRPGSWNRQDVEGQGLRQAVPSSCSAEPSPSEPSGGPPGASLCTPADPSSTPQLYSISPATFPLCMALQEALWTQDPNPSPSPGGPSLIQGGPLMHPLSHYLWDGRSHSCPPALASRSLPVSLHLSLDFGGPGGLSAFPVELDSVLSQPQPLQGQVKP